MKLIKSIDNILKNKKIDVYIEDYKYCYNDIFDIIKKPNNDYYIKAKVDNFTNEDLWNIENCCHGSYEDAEYFLFLELIKIIKKDIKPRFYKFGSKLFSTCKAITRGYFSNSFKVNYKTCEAIEYLNDEKYKIYILLKTPNDSFIFSTKELKIYNESFDMIPLFIIKNKNITIVGHMHINNHSKEYEINRFDIFHNKNFNKLNYVCGKNYENSMLPFENLGIVNFYTGEKNKHLIFLKFLLKADKNKLENKTMEEIVKNYKKNKKLII